MNETPLERLAEQAGLTEDAHTYDWPYDSSTANETLDDVRDKAHDGNDEATRRELTKHLEALQGINSSARVAHYSADLHHAVDAALACAALVLDKRTGESRYTGPLDRSHNGEDPPYLDAFPTMGPDMVRRAHLAVQRAVELLDHPDYYGAWENQHLYAKHKLALMVLRDRLAEQVEEIR